MKKSTIQVAKHKLSALVFALLTAAVGLVLLHAASAATNAATVEAESGSRTANAVLTSDANASGGAAVMFSPVPGPTPTGGSPGTPPTRDDASIADEPGQFNLECGVPVRRADDPIVFPNQPGVSHMHDFMGNKSTSASSTFESLMANTSDCNFGMDTLDRSAYWSPSLVETATGKVLASDSQFLFPYYRRAGAGFGPPPQAFPNGLRMITGNSKATSPQGYVKWMCGFGGGTYDAPPTCPASEDTALHAFFPFPNCWNGNDLDSADHKSHMAFSSYKGVCPASHPVVLPELWLEIVWPGIYDGSKYTLSSGGKYSMHGDVFIAWNMQAQRALTDTCLVHPVACGQIDHTSGGTILKFPNRQSNTPGPDSVDYSKY